MPRGRFGFERELSGITVDFLRGSGAVRVARDIKDSETRRGCFDFDSKTLQYVGTDRVS